MISQNCLLTKLLYKNCYFKGIANCGILVFDKTESLVVTSSSSFPVQEHDTTDSCKGQY